MLRRLVSFHVLPSALAWAALKQASVCLHHYTGGGEQTIATSTAQLPTRQRPTVCFAAPCRAASTAAALPCCGPAARCCSVPKPSQGAATAQTQLRRTAPRAGCARPRSGAARQPRNRWPRQRRRRTCIVKDARFTQVSLCRQVCSRGTDGMTRLIWQRNAAPANNASCGAHMTQRSCSSGRRTKAE